jgi:N-acetylneuraminate lyase
MKKLEGLISAPFTAFRADGELNLPVVDQQLDLLVANGISAALVGGTTGESGSLTLEERMTLTARWCEATRCSEDFPIIAHVGDSCLKNSQALASHAQSVGAWAVAALAPYYFKPASVEILVAHCREIAAAAPDLPFYYYHLPGITGVSFPVIQFLRAMGDQIPNFAGVKYTYEDMSDFGLCLEFENRRYDIMCGRDESLLAGLALGAAGAVGSTYNYMAPVYLEMIAAFNRGDLATAQASQEQARQIIEVMVRFGGIPAAKSIMKMIGIDCGDVRLPLTAVTNETYEAFHTALEGAGFFQFCSRLPNSAATS